MNKTTLILTFNGISGVAREQLHTHVQNELFKLGYAWPLSLPDRKKVTKTKADRLYVEPVTPDGPRITYGSGRFEIVSYNSTVGQTSHIFSAQDEVDKFLAAAAEFLKPIERVIEGVKVTVSPREVKLDPTELLQRVTTQAQKVQTDTFGAVS